MDYGKIDAWLSAELGNESLTCERNLLVFVEITAPPDGEQKEELKRLGLADIASDRTIFSAQMSSQQVSELSDKPWVRLLSLSKKLNYQS
jgi:hypothetical protein